MIHYLIYLLEVSICLALFYLVYVLFVSGDTFHKLKRYYLLFAVFISTLIPQLPSHQITEEIEKNLMTNYTFQTDPSNYRDSFEKLVFGNVPARFGAEDSALNPPFLLLLTAIYLMGMIYMFYKLLVNLFTIRKLITANRKERHEKYTLVDLPEGYSSFTFFNYIFLNSKNLNGEDKEDILLHEQEHSARNHSADIIFIELIKVFLWFNPIIWLIKKSLVKTHECLADQSVISNKLERKEDYQSLLLKQYLSNFKIELAHPFNYSLIKFRIKMMTKKESKWWAKYKMIFALPVVFIGLIAFTNADINISKDRISQQDNVDDSFESQPEGMIFIPQGSFLLNRTDGETTKEFEVTIDPFWMKETEVSVREYLDYMESIKKDSSSSVYKQALPNKSKAPIENYYTSKKYRDYPVVGVSLLQAVNYCNWKTSLENQMLKSQGKKLVYSYRVPYDVEWFYASFGGMSPDEIEKSIPSDLSKTGSKKPNDWGLLNMFDNVSEWTSTVFEPEKYMTELLNPPKTFNEKIIVAGNNFKYSVANDKTILNGGDTYDYVGFRYVRTYRGNR